METNTNPDTAGELRKRRLVAGLTQQQLAYLAEDRTRVLTALHEHEAICQPEGKRDGNRRTGA